MADGRCEGTNVSNVETQFTSGLPPVVLTRMVPKAITWLGALDDRNAIPAIPA